MLYSYVIIQSFEKVVDLVGYGTWKDNLNLVQACSSLDVSGFARWMRRLALLEGNVRCSLARAGALVCICNENNESKKCKQVTT